MRPRRRFAAALVGAAVLVLGGVIAAFTVAASSSDDPPPPATAPAVSAATTAPARFSAVRRDDGRLRITGTVPDGITSVTVGTRTVPVRGHRVALTVAERPDVVVLQGPAAAHIRGRPDVAVVTRTGDPPAVAVSFDPGPDAHASGTPVSP